MNTQLLANPLLNTDANGRAAPAFAYGEGK